MRKDNGPFLRVHIDGVDWNDVGKNVVSLLMDEECCDLLAAHRPLFVATY